MTIPQSIWQILSNDSHMSNSLFEKALIHFWRLKNIFFQVVYSLTTTLVWALLPNICSFQLHLIFSYQTLLFPATFKNNPLYFGCKTPTLLKPNNSSTLSYQQARECYEKTQFADWLHFKMLTKWLLSIAWQSYHIPLLFFSSHSLRISLILTPHRTPLTLLPLLNLADDSALYCEKKWTTLYNKFYYSAYMETHTSYWGT